MNIRKAFRSLSVLWLGALAGAFFAFVTQAMLARALGAYEYGLFSAALATIAIVSPLAGFGVPGFWLRVFGEEGYKAFRWVQPSLLFIILTSSVLFILINIWASQSATTDASRHLVMILSFYIFGQAAVELSIAKAQLVGDYPKVAIWQAAPHFIRLFSIFFISCLLGGKVSGEYIAYCYSILSILIALVCAFQLRDIILHRSVLAGHDQYGAALQFGLKESPGVFNVAVGAFPYGAVGVLYLIYFQSSVVVLGMLAGPETAGIFNIAFVILSAIYLFPSIVYQKFMMPMIQRWGCSDPAKSYFAYRAGGLMMLVVGMSIALAVFFISPVAIPLIFGAEYSISSEILRLLAICIPLRFVSSSSGAFLNVGRHVGAKIIIMAIAAIINISINFMVVPSYGLHGAVISVITTEAFLFIVFTLYAWNKIFQHERCAR
ncbi:oligosaccharide flippase family protein [Stutzerimonas stutzeri]|uniref:oligosaccharide flippase family protein n=1 Tax=Stutzerimonas stutzeri TaxID=316 RepID=UPI001C753970|nr:oligosaccharide flippase family protein [Stutzerimonas stutzeri]BCY01817.1 flippase [Stutzerimonas stutzeri]